VNAARRAYAVNWGLTKRLLARAGGSRAGGRELGEIGQPQFLSVVARVPNEVAAPLAAAAAALGEGEADHHVYPAESIHLTVLALADEAGAHEAVGAIAARHRPFAIDAGGLNLSARTVFAELYPSGSGLAALRRALRAALAPLHPAVSQWVRQRLAHASVARLGGPPDRRVIAEVERLRARDFGRFEVAEIELVRTDKILSAEGTIVLGRFPLGPPRHQAHPG
jgi:2'-5' RNA ligase